jgi:tRNA (guanine-N7-)-methyltransferase
MASYDWRKVEQLPWPTDWAGWFGRPAPLVMEIGFGTGLFLVDLARRRPDLNLIGVEISLPALRHAARKIERAGLANVCLLHGVAEAALQTLCAPSSLDGVIINFPDPWPKATHQGRRLINDGFLCLLATRLRPSGELDIATDHAEYAEHIVACLLRSPHFAGRDSAPFTLHEPNRIRTKYEETALREGRPPRYFHWQRNETPAGDRFPIPQELTMPHVVLRLPADPAEIGRRFRPATIERERARIRFVEAYQSLRHDKLMIETYINEEPIMQRVGLEVRARATGEIVIGLAEIGFPRPTRGVHLAVGYLVEWLTEEFPSLVIEQSTLQEPYAHHTRQRN